MRAVMTGPAPPVDGIWDLGPADADIVVYDPNGHTSIGYGEGTIHFNINRRQVINGRAVVRLQPTHGVTCGLADHPVSPCHAEH